MLTGVRLKERTKLFLKKMQGPADTIRLSILYILAYGELPLHEIVANIDKPQSLVAHHILFLEKTGWVSKRKAGRETYYRVNDRYFFELIRFVSDSPLYREKLAKKLH